jgi:hypothetical protein
MEEWGVCFPMEDIVFECCCDMVIFMQGRTPGTTGLGGAAGVGAGGLGLPISNYAAQDSVGHVRGGQTVADMAPGQDFRMVSQGGVCGDVGKGKG